MDKKAQGLGQFLNLCLGAIFGSTKKRDPDVAYHPSGGLTDSYSETRRKTMTTSSDACFSIHRGSGLPNGL